MRRLRRERLWIWLGRKLVPETIRYWILIDAFAEASFRHPDMEPDFIGFSKVMGGGSRRLEDCSVPVLDLEDQTESKREDD